jgi:hypothetical protein
MLARASTPIDPSQQAMLFYLYSDDLEALREHLLVHDANPGPIRDGSPGPAHELRVRDPDGYTAIIALNE